MNDPHFDDSLLENDLVVRSRRSSSLGMDFRQSTKYPENQHRMQRIRRRRRTLSAELMKPKISPSVLRKRLNESEHDEMLAVHRVEEWSRRTRDTSFPSNAVSTSNSSSPKCRKRPDDHLYTPELLCRCVGGIIAAHILHNSELSPTRMDNHASMHKLASVFNASPSPNIEMVTLVGFNEGECRVCCSLFCRILWHTQLTVFSPLDYSTSSPNSYFAQCANCIYVHITTLPR